MKNAAAHTTSSRSAATAQPVLGIVKTTYPRIDSSRPAVNDAEFSPAAELDAWARRVFAANGFGDAQVAPSVVGAAPNLIDLPSAARKHRSAAFWEVCFAIGEAIGAAFDRAATRWREQREMRRTYDELSGLDARTLKDIGISDHEAGSIAAELVGRAERTRIQALRALRELTI